MENHDVYGNYVRNRIAQIRIARGLSERELSIMLDKSFTYIHDINSKRSLPSMRMFFKICDCLEVSPDVFFNDEIKYPTETQEVVKELERLMSYEDICSYKKGLAKVNGEHIQVLRHLFSLFLST